MFYPLTGSLLQHQIRTSQKREEGQGAVGEYKKISGQKRGRRKNKSKRGEEKERRVISSKGTGNDGHIFV